MAKLRAREAEDGEFEPWYQEDDIVEAVAQEVTLKEFTYPDKATGKMMNGEKLEWVFMVTEDGPAKGKNIRGETSTAFTAHPNCKAYNWAMKITGVATEPGQEFDTDAVWGLPCRIVIGHQKDKKDPNRVWLRAKDVFPMRGRATAPSAPTPEEAPF